MTGETGGALRRTPDPRLPLDPLLEHGARRAGVLPAPGGYWFHALAHDLDCHPSTPGKWAKRGLSIYVADRSAVALGVHPGDLWPEWWSLTDIESTQHKEQAA